MRRPPAVHKRHGHALQNTGRKSYKEFLHVPFSFCCLFHCCLRVLTGCLSVLTVVSVCDRVEIWQEFLP